MSLLEAIQNRNLSMFFRTLDGSNPNQTTKGGLSLLMMAISLLESRNEFDPESDYKLVHTILSSLIYKGADVNAVDSYNNTTLIHFVSIGHVQTPSCMEIFYLLLKESNVRHQNNNGETALTKAIEMGKENEWTFVGPLIDKSDCRQIDEDGHSALNKLIASYSEEYSGRTDSRAELAQKLIDCGSNIDHIDKLGYSILDYATVYDANPIIEVLILNNAQLTETAEETMEESENPFVYGLLQQARDRDRIFSSTNASNIRTESALLYAIFRGNVEKVQDILNNENIDINAFSASGTTPLMIATTRKHVRVVEELLKYPGIEINRQDSQGFSALHYAAIVGHSDILKLLLDAGANRTITNNYGLRPFNYSRKYEIKSLLSSPFIPKASLKYLIRINASVSKNRIQTIRGLNADLDFDNTIVLNAMESNDLCQSLNREYVRNCLETCDIAIVLTQDSEILGLCLIFVKDTFYVDIFCTNPQYRGIGTYLMGVIKQLARDLHLDIFLCSVPTAVGFYEKVEFSKNSTGSCEPTLIPMRYTHKGGKRKKHKTIRNKLRNTRRK